jgi:hypothetical protein
VDIWFVGFAPTPSDAALLRGLWTTVEDDILRFEEGLGGTVNGREIPTTTEVGEVGQEQGRIVALVVNYGHLGACSRRQVSSI